MDAMHSVTFTDLCCCDNQLVHILQLSQCLCVCVGGGGKVGGDKGRGRMRDAEEGKEGKGGDVSVLRYSLMVLSDYSLH